MNRTTLTLLAVAHATLVCPASGAPKGPISPAPPLSQEARIEYWLTRQDEETIHRLGHLIDLQKRRKPARLIPDSLEKLLETEWNRRAQSVSDLAALGIEGLSELLHRLSAWEFGLLKKRIDQGLADAKKENAQVWREGSSDQIASHDRKLEEIRQLARWLDRWDRRLKKEPRDELCSPDSPAANLTIAEFLAETPDALDRFLWDAIDREDIESVLRLATALVAVRARNSRLSGREAIRIHEKAFEKVFEVLSHAIDWETISIEEVDQLVPPEIISAWDSRLGDSKLPPRLRTIARYKLVSARDRRETRAAVRTILRLGTTIRASHDDDKEKVVDFTTVKGGPRVEAFESEEVRRALAAFGLSGLADPKRQETLHIGDTLYFPPAGEDGVIPTMKKKDYDAALPGLKAQKVLADHGISVSPKEGIHLKRPKTLSRSAVENPEHPLWAALLFFGAPKELVAKLADPNRRDTIVLEHLAFLPPSTKADERGRWIGKESDELTILPAQDFNDRAQALREEFLAKAQAYAQEVAKHDAFLAKPTNFITNFIGNSIDEKFKRHYAGLMKLIEKMGKIGLGQKGITEARKIAKGILDNEATVVDSMRSSAALTGTILAPLIPLAVVFPKVAAAGVAVGAAINVVTQWLRTSEQKAQSEFDGDELLASSVLGGLLAPTTQIRYLGGLVTGASVAANLYTAEKNFTNGHVWSGRFHTALAVLAIVLGRRPPNLGSKTSTARLSAPDSRMGSASSGGAPKASLSQSHLSGRPRAGDSGGTARPVARLDPRSAKNCEPSSLEFPTWGSNARVPQPAAPRLTIFRAETEPTPAPSTPAPAPSTPPPAPDKPVFPFSPFPSPLDPKKRGMWVDFTVPPDEAPRPPDFDPKKIVELDFDSPPELKPVHLIPKGTPIELPFELPKPEWTAPDGKDESPPLRVKGWEPPKPGFRWDPPKGWRVDPVTGTINTGQRSLPSVRELLDDKSPLRPSLSTAPWTPPPIPSIPKPPRGNADADAIRRGFAETGFSDVGEVRKHVHLASLVGDIIREGDPSLPGTSSFPTLPPLFHSQLKQAFEKLAEALAIPAQPVDDFERELSAFLDVAKKPRLYTEAEARRARPDLTQKLNSQDENARRAAQRELRRLTEQPNPLAMKRAGSDDNFEKWRALQHEKLLKKIHRLVLLLPKLITEQGAKLLLVDEKGNKLKLHPDSLPLLEVAPTRAHGEGLNRVRFLLKGRSESYALHVEIPSTAPSFPGVHRPLKQAAESLGDILSAHAKTFDLTPEIAARSAMIRHLRDLIETLYWIDLSLELDKTPQKLAVSLNHVDRNVIDLSGAIASHYGLSYLDSALLTGWMKNPSHWRSSPEKPSLIALLGWQRSAPNAPVQNGNSAPHAPHNKPKGDANKVLFTVTDHWWFVPDRVEPEFLEVPFNPSDLQHPHEIWDTRKNLATASISVSTEEPIVPHAGYIPIARPTKTRLSSLRVVREGKMLQEGKDFRVVHVPSRVAWFVYVGNDPRPVDYQAGFVESPREAIPPAVDKELRDLDRNALAAEAKHLSDARIRQLAVSIGAQAMSKQKQSVWDLARSFHATHYADSPSRPGPLSSATGPFADYSRFADDQGRFCAQCDGGNALFTDLLKDYFARTKSKILPENRHGYFIKNGRSTDDDAHIRTNLFLPGRRDPLVVDATPMGDDPTLTKDPELQWQTLAGWDPAILSGRAKALRASEIEMIRFLAQPENRAQHRNDRSQPHLEALALARKIRLLLAALGNRQSPIVPKEFKSAAAYAKNLLGEAQKIGEKLHRFERTKDWAALRKFPLYEMPLTTLQTDALLDKIRWALQEMHDRP